MEGPPDAQDLLPWMQNPGLKPPVALLLYVPDQPKKGVYYPFAEFSPEWQAIQYGLAHAVPVRFMDLPQAYQLAAPEPEETLTPISEAAAAPTQIRDPLTWLAETAGYSDGERWWEHIVEQRRSHPQEIFSGIQEMITTLRGEVEQMGAGSVFPISPFEAQREAFMRQTMRAAQAEGFQKIAVVCGAWHSPALASPVPAGEDAKLLKGLDKVKVAAAWVPWSYGRLSWESGYGAGIESPGWYEDYGGARPGVFHGYPIHWLTRVAHLLRPRTWTLRRRT